MTASRDVVGVDIGGTKISAGYLDEDGRLIETGVEPTPPADGQANLKAVRRLLGSPKLAGARNVGVSMATTIESDGTLRDPHNWFGWKGADLVELLSLENQSVHIIADAEAGAVGERSLGASRPFHSSLYVSVGTGIAHCFIEGDRQLRGAHNSAYFSGYTIPARCAWPGCDAPFVERISSGTAIARQYFGDERGDTRLVFDRAREGDPRAADIVEHAAWHLGILIGNLMLIFDPDGGVVGGGLGSGQEAYRQRAISVAREHVSVAHTKLIPIVPAALGRASCWAGAIVAVQKRTHQRAAPVGAVSRGMVA